MGALNLIFTMTLLFNFILKEAVTSKCISNPLTISLPQGEIKGSYDERQNQIKFLGIPYASVKEKFQPPGEPPSWNGTLNADRGSIKCKQYHEQWKMVIGQEDCLVLNVFTPTYQHKKPFPVMVFIHGGGFYAGSNDEELYNPKYLVKEKVIVVTINYRLGALGFLCLPLKEAPGNAGLKDQLTALKWIQNNIAYFSGDPDSVTLFGQTAGGASINYFILSNCAKGLFNRAIIHSGTILSPQAFDYDPIASASKVALRLEYNTSDPKELLQIYKNTPVDDIIEASSGNTTDSALASYVFAPCAEFTNRRHLITKKPRDLLKKDGLNISTIIGMNNKEGIQWASAYVPINLDKMKENLDDIIPKNLLFGSKTDRDTFIHNIMSVYFSNGSATENLIDYFTDSIIRYPLTTVSEHLCKNKNRSIYNYYNTYYDDNRTINKLITSLSEVRGAANADDLFCLFHPASFKQLSANSKVRTMITTMVKLWANFAKTGKPTHTNIEWHSSGDRLKFMQLVEEIKIITLPNEDRMEFWRETYNKYGRH